MAELAPCPSCRFDNLKTAKFCSECGQVMVRRCPSCSVEVTATAKFCSDCGHTFELLQAMRLATKLASVQEELKTLQNKGQKLMKKWEKDDAGGKGVSEEEAKHINATKTKCSRALKRILK